MTTRRGLLAGILGVASLAAGARLRAGPSGVAQGQVPPPPPAPPVPTGPAGPPPAASPGASPPGRSAPPEVVQELRAALALGLQRFEAKDLEGVLALVSEQYWTGPFTKTTVRVQLLAMFRLNREVRARVRLDDVRLVGEHAWVYSTGEVTGQLPVLGQWTQLLVWERELEVARREQGAWRLYGYQQ